MTATENRSGPAAPTDLEEVLATLTEAGNGDDITVAAAAEAFGHRSIGAMLLVPALISLIPGVGAVPGVPTICGTISILIAGQILIGQRHLWLPGPLRRRKIARRTLERGMRYAMPAARGVDRLIRPRLTPLTRGPFVKVIAAICVLLALTMPPLELVPMAGIVPATAIAIFGLALVARDGLLVASGLVVSGASAYAVWRYLL